MIRFRGSYAALITPFKKGKVDYRRLQANIEFQVKSGTSGIVPCGTTGESPTLSHEEHMKVIMTAVEAADKRIQVIAGTGSNSTEEAVALSKYAKKAGANAILSVVPYYNKPTQDGLYAHFKTIAKKSAIPIVLYNIPGRCGTMLTPATVERLSKIDMIVGIKEATGSMDQTTDILARCDIAVLSGDDSLTLPLLSIGATGVISVIANIFPKDVSNMIDAYFEGHMGLAQNIHFRLFPLCKALFVETNPIPIKTAMKMMKMDSGELRLPLVKMSPDNVRVLMGAIKSYKAERQLTV